MIYVAAPYSDPDPAVKAERMRQFYEFDAMLCREGHFTVSPLYKVETAKHGKIPDDWAYWQSYSENMLKRCDMMILLALDGWQDSVGVQGELEFCYEHGIQVVVVAPNWNEHYQPNRGLTQVVTVNQK